MSVGLHILKPHDPTSYFLYILHVACSQLSHPLSAVQYIMYFRLCWWRHVCT